MVTTIDVSSWIKTEGKMYLRLEGTEIMQLIRRILERTSGRTSIIFGTNPEPKGNSSQTNTFHPRIVVDNLLASEYPITSATIEEGVLMKVPMTG